MTKDSVLGWILFLLVGISLFLSYNIWVKIPVDNSSVSQLFAGKSVELASVISPEKIVVHPENTYHTLLKQSSPFYERIWSFSRKALASLWSESSLASAQITDDFFAMKKGIEVVFPVPLPTTFLKQFLNINTGRDFLENSTISSFYLVEDGTVNAYLRDTSGAFYKINKSQNSTELLELLKDLVNAKAPRYANLPQKSANLNVSGGVYVSLTSYRLPTYFMKQEQVLSDRTAAKFFPDFSVTRKIEEKDGAVIYTDGQRGLRVYPNGALEYNAPGKGDSKTAPNFYEALNTAVDFVNARGGWPESAYLSDYNIANENGSKIYKFSFGIRVFGCPLVSEKDYISLTVDGNQVKNFYKEVVTVDRPGGVMTLMSPIEALDLAVSQYKVNRVEDIYPAYISSEDLLLPVWVVKTPEERIIISNPSE